MDFPSNRFRQVFHFKEDNICDYLVLSPVDEHYMDTGMWEYNDITRIMLIMDNNNDIKFEFKIIELSEDLLIIKRIY